MAIHEPVGLHYCIINCSSYLDYEIRKGAVSLCLTVSPCEPTNRMVKWKMSHLQQLI